MGDAEPVILRISSERSTKYLKTVAGAMSWQLREKGECRVRTIKSSPCNTAIKAVAILNSRVRAKGVDITFSVDPVFSSADKSDESSESTVIEMNVSAPDMSPPPIHAEYKVSGRQSDDKSIVSRLATALTAPAREGKAIRMRCIGALSVYRAVQASCVAKGNLYTNGMRAMVVPTWGTMDGDGKQVSLIYVDFWGEQRP